MGVIVKQKVKGPGEWWIFISDQQSVEHDQPHFFYRAVRRLAGVFYGQKLKKRDYSGTK